MSLSSEMLISSLEMFAFLAVELTILFLAISYFVGILQEYIPPSRVQKILSSQNGKGYVTAAALGVITPFCSCSTIPFLKGLLRARAGFGTMMVFLFASPLLNPVIIGLFAITFGIQVTVFYFTIALAVSIIAGYTLEKLGFEKFVKEEAYAAPSSSSCGSSCGGSAPVQSKWARVWNSTWTDFKKVLPYLIGGIAIGSVIYGFMPTDLVSSWAGKDNVFAIPVAAVIGIPLYIRAEAVIPLTAALAGKGMGLGAIMALIIGSAGASLTEVILLKSLFKNQMIAAFLVVILGMAVSAGVLYTAIF
ncbi:permease [Pseudovibrio sp. SCP19]|uniref:permease n=1 Tax=Pseudovibrio sp. SCP19 TaxID=3141374 RepID=UPI00333849E5